MAGIGLETRFSACRAIPVIVLALLLSLGVSAQAQGNRAGIHEGVASCGGSACHSRLVASGKTVTLIVLLAGAAGVAFYLKGRRDAGVPEAFTVEEQARLDGLLGDKAG